MDTLIVMCGVAVVFTVGAMATPVQQLTDKASLAIDDDRYIKLLGRVENLEDRDREQQAEINVLRSELNTEKQRTSRLEATIARLMLNIGKPGQDDVKKIFETEESTQQETKIIAEEKLHDTRSGIIAGEHASRIRRQEVVPVIAFHATLAHSQPHSGVHQSIAFDNVITNIGAAYNPHVGSFIAPVPGVYVFSATILGYGNIDLHCIIAKNGASVANLYMRDQESRYGSDSAMVVLHLNKGDDVEVQGVDPDKFIHGDHYSMFSGFLLHEDQPTESIVG